MLSPRSGAGHRSAAEQRVAQLLGVPAAHLELDGADDDRAPAVVHPHLADVRQRHERAAVDPDEAGSAHRSSSTLSGTRTRCEPVVGVQPGVVAVGLRVADLAAGDEPGDATELDGDGLVLDEVPSRPPRRGRRHPRGLLALGATTRRIASESRSARTGFMT